MKRLLLSAVILSACVAPALQGYYHEDSRQMTSCCEAFCAVAALVGIAGLAYYAIKQEPFNLLDSAHSTYSSIDRRVLRLFEKYLTDCYDVADIAAMVYSRSSYPLVFAAQQLEAARGQIKEALRDVRKALTMLNKELFVQECNRLSNALRARLELIDELIDEIHSNYLWKQQYALYLQEINLREMRRLQDRIDDLTLRQRQPVVYFENQVYWY